MQLYSQHNFTVVRQISDHTDATVYYVRAVVRNAYTDEIIATLDLDSKGSQRYKKDWRIPADPSGEGFYISIVTSVYSDSGHTTKSPSYGDEENTYLVIDRPRVVGGSIGNGGGLARRDVRDIIVEELQKIIPQLTPKENDSQFSELLTAIKNIKDSIKPSEKVDFTRVFEQIATLQTSINAIKIPKLDLSPILSSIKDNLDKNKITSDEIKTILDDLEISITEEVKKTITTELKKMSFITSFITHPIGGNKSTPQSKQVASFITNAEIGKDEIPNNIDSQEEVDLSKLAS